MRIGVVEQRWPVAPLLATVGYEPVAPGVSRESHRGDLPVGMTAAAEQLGVSTRTLHRWIADGVPDSQADACATRLGRHPSDIWRNWEAEDPHCAWTVVFTCPVCSSAVRPVSMGDPAEGGTRIAGVARCDGFEQHRVRVEVGLVIV